ncbi:conserved Plasmodium protein, unknown function [Plasmodium berghei]|uniref:Uncharacterized protein n=2 Tax=Plasmodium berghei TaxID=5821 RepID=A0A509ALV3_PLABA|nr:conserved protein, unknown function [Plasmodium berghei ANKA]CXI43784.1 conserved Plasmodium protein, unknown function [Plasmodium berghei]SCM22394.1 conserved Plasmodium protein, unknown function [Plasmodium berghei]SCN25418.1 conserved Plasmodium protein, unknown function [Plasmodium berghei]SCO60394.1 conserved Plasmodium protein, unknown function [Plasmodium berghei]SCO62160.1 conserved Plasmodium protein, unknown function [Plasmodium berghei]|eukprot:XP_034421621.1 conserved protein, unknown function [Plasmodium berghei ANKA]
MYKFPCFRDKTWMKENGGNMNYPDEFFNVDFCPEFLKNYEHIVNFQEKIDQIIKQIKSALFRQAIYKIQNIEVLAMNECKEDRVLENIKPIIGYEKFKITNSTILRDELWRIKRCNQHFLYWVRYYEQDKNGYSLSIMPMHIKNIFKFFKYYYF